MIRNVERERCTSFSNNKPIMLCESGPSFVSSTGATKWSAWFNPSTSGDYFYLIANNSSIKDLANVPEESVAFPAGNFDNKLSSVC